jgi:hypothetical protein
MRALIQDVLETTQVRDRDGNAIYTFTGNLFTLILRLFMGGLFLLAIGGIIVFVALWIAGETDPSNANFGYFG